MSVVRRCKNRRICVDQSWQMTATRSAVYKFRILECCPVSLSWHWQWEVSSHRKRFSTMTEMVQPSSLGPFSGSFWVNFFCHLTGRWALLPLMYRKCAEILGQLHMAISRKRKEREDQNFGAVAKFKKLFWKIYKKRKKHKKTLLFKRNRNNFLGCKWQIAQRKRRNWVISRILDFRILDSGL